MQYTEQLIEDYKYKKNFRKYGEVAEELGISLQFLSNIRCGRASLPEKAMLKIANELNVELDTVVSNIQLEKAKRSGEVQTTEAWERIVKKLERMASTTAKLSFGAVTTGAVLNELVTNGDKIGQVINCAQCILC